MPQFQYQGRDSEGKRISGERSGMNERTIASTLIQQGITPLMIKEIAITIQKEDDEKGVFDIDLRDIFTRSVPLNDVIMFIRQMYSLTKAGVPMMRAIEGLASNSTNRRLGRALQGISDQLERGRSLSAAMAEYPHCFPKLVIAVVHVGENTGRLDEAFLQVGEYLERELET
ncbi:type II secretion system F family protein, partial [Aliidiomarina sp.]|uniref:type II secretion system F family protein n=1 Tax=Aliidiomarina sp. TaxID=1872439 RepID=UPI003A4DF034